MSVHCIYKNKKITSYQAVESLRAYLNLDKSSKLGYAGRLDPMAEGLFLVLEGDDNKRQKDFFEMDKEYVIEAVFGVGTDTGDVLGFVSSDIRFVDFRIDELMRACNKFVGKYFQKVPVYSAVRVQGKPLFWWAKNDKLEEINIPSYERNIFSIDILEKSGIDIKSMRDMVFDSISGVIGHFRQEETSRRWQEFFDSHAREKYIKVILRVNCSSGTFMRQLITDIADSMGMSATIVKLTRTRVGEYDLNDALSLK